MAYNFRLKEYGNGTLQLTFYRNQITTKDDFYPLMYDPDYPPDNDEDYEIEEGWKRLKGLSPFDMPATKLTPEDEYLTMSEEELQEKKDRSLQSSLNRSKRMIYDYGRANVWEWFFTLTFEHVDSFTAENYCECSAKVRKWFKNIREKHCPNIKYLIVPEQHKSGAWHFHAMVSNCDELTFVKAVNNQKYRKDKETGEILLDEKGQPVPNKYFGDYLRTSYPVGDFIYNIAEYKNGFSTATKITDTRKAVSYVVKYITKDLCECTFGKRRYLPSNNLNLPKITYIGGMADRMEELITEIEYHYGAKLSIEHMKSYIVELPNYYNAITIFEFEVSQEKKSMGQIS